MATTTRYLTSIKNLPAILQKIQHGVPPDKFNNDHLKAIGFSSSNDRGVIPLLKDIGFLTTDGSPTQRYRDYRDTARSRSVMAQALREAYPDIFVINENISKSDREAVTGRFKSLHDSSDVVADAQARTFFALLDHADFRIPSESTNSITDKVEKIPEESSHNSIKLDAQQVRQIEIPLSYRFEIQLPATKDVEVFRAIFRAMREELLNG